MGKICLVFFLLFLPIQFCFAEETIELEKIVVTPYRYAEDQGSASTNLTVLTETDFKKANSVTVLDALRTVPGLIIRDFYGNTAKATVDIRGFGEQAGMNSAVLVDGRKINEVDLSAVDWSQIPLSQISRIEIVRGGSGSVLYGDNAVSGVINLITKKGQGPLKIDLESQYGSYDLNSQIMSLSGSRGELSYRVSASHFGTHGYRNNSGFKTYDFSSKFEYTLSDFWEVWFSNGYHKANYGLPGELTAADVETFNRRYSKYGEDYVNDKDYYFDSGIKKTFIEWGELSLGFSYRRRDTYSYFVGANSGWNPTLKSYIETYALTPKYILEKDFLGHSNKIIVGLDIYRYDYSSDTYNISDVPQDFNDINKITTGIYLQDEFSLSNQLKLVGGYRRESAKYEFDYHDNSGFYSDIDDNSEPLQRAYNFGLVYNYLDNSNLFFNISRSFRYPAVDEYFTWGSLNLDLKPQVSRNYELGLRHSINSNTEFLGSVFKMDLKDELYYNPTGGPYGFGANENYDKTSRQGFEMSVNSRVNSFLALEGSYTYLEAKFEGNLYKDKFIPMVPKDKIVLAVKLFPFDNFNLNILGNYIGNKYYINDQENKYKKLGGYFIADINASYRVGNFTFLLGVNNIFDKKYSEYGVCNATTGAKNFYPSPARNLVFKTQYQF